MNPAGGPELGIGVIGAGVIGRTHLATLQRESGCRIVGLADPTPVARDRPTRSG
jgi:predicted dehydrogenase